MEEQTFREQARQEGYADPVVVEWAGGTFNDTHAHAYAAWILVLSGAMTVTTPERESTCGAGHTERLERGTPHSEQVGPDGVRFLAARKH